MIRNLSLFLILSMAPHAMAAAPGPVGDTEKVRKAIDYICGDTWCEGDYSFRFKKVVLDVQKQQTKVLFAMGLRGFSPRVANNDGFESTLDQANFDVSCTVKGFSNVDQILADEHTLKWEFYTQLSDCVNSLEDKVRGLSNVLYDGSQK